VRTVAAPVRVASPPSAGWSAPRALAAAALLALALFAARLWTGRAFDAGPRPMPLTDARDLPVIRADGTGARLGDALRPGLPTLVSVWASWCGPCRQEAPAIAALRRRFGPERLNIVYLNARDADAAPAWRDAMTRAAGLTPGSQVRMEDASLVRFTNDPAPAIPRTYLYDRRGSAVATIIGYKPLALARIAGLVEDDRS